MKHFSTTSLIVAGLPLVIYPFVVLADIMSLAADWSGTKFTLLTVVALFCQLGSLFYPVVYFTCLATYRSKIKRQEVRAAFRFSVAPLAFLIILIGAFMLWMQLEE